MTPNQQQVDPLAKLLGPIARQVDSDIDRLLVEPGCPNELADAMRYCTLGGGKRLRPCLVHLACRAVGGEVDELTSRAAVAVELVHCYSLVHDDLPAMDDDTLRRGRPTAHVKFGEAMAILAGDALLTRAFGLIAQGNLHAGRGPEDSDWPGSATDDARAAAIVWELSAAAGQAGMIAGQVADMELCSVPAAAEGLRYTHARKTAALIRSAARMGAISGRAGAAAIAAVSRYAFLLGLAFQVWDDVLDVTAPVEKIGKTPGKDAASGKRTYVSELGVQRATGLAGELTQLAVESLAALNSGADTLAELAHLLTDRSY